MQRIDMESLIKKYKLDFKNFLFPVNNIWERINSYIK